MRTYIVGRNDKVSSAQVRKSDRHLLSKEENAIFICNHKPLFPALLQGGVTIKCSTTDNTQRNDTP